MDALIHEMSGLPNLVVALSATRFVGTGPRPQVCGGSPCRPHVGGPEPSAPRGRGLVFRDRSIEYCTLSMGCVARRSCLIGRGVIALLLGVSLFGVTPDLQAGCGDDVLGPTTG